MYKTIAKIDGMMCAMCEAHVQDAIRKIPEVKRVKASKGKKEVKILSNQTLTEEILHSALDPTGYKLGEIKSEPYEKKGLLSFLFF